MTGNPAAIAADLISQFPDDREPQTPQSLPGDETGHAARAATCLAHTERCIARLELAGDDVTPIREQLPILWSAVCFRRRVPGTDPALATLRMFGMVINKARMLPTVGAGLRQSLQDLDQLVRADDSIPQESRDRLLMLIAEAMKACDDVDLVGAVTVDDAVGQVVVEVLRVAPAVTDQSVYERMKAILWRLVAETGYGIPLAALTEGAARMIGG